MAEKPFGSLAEYYANCAIKKGTPRSVEKLAKTRAAEKQERTTRTTVNARDKHRCFWPGCKETAFHKHHKVYRSKGGKWETENIVSGCGVHHKWVHDKLIRLVGNPDVAPVGVELTPLGRAAKIRIPKRAA